MNVSPQLLRFAVGALVILLVGALMYTGTVSSEAGIAIIIAIASGLGVYEGQKKVRGGK